MTKFTRIRTTIPPRTYGSGHKGTTPHTILLRMSFLELERQRRVQESEQLTVRKIASESRIEEIDREKLVLRLALEKAVEPLDSAGVVPVTLTARRQVVQSRAKGGFAIRY